MAHVKPSGHPSWKVLAEPLLAFLQEGPKTWADLDEFRCRTAGRKRPPQELIANILAWLDNCKLARSYYDSEGRLCWVASVMTTPPKPRAICGDADEK